MHNELKLQAEKYRDLYKMGVIDRDLAKTKIMPFIDDFNQKTIDIAKKYNQKPRKISFIKYVR